ncbi:MAG: hypothetical protein V1839_04135 [archaeon]
MEKLMEKQKEHKVNHSHKDIAFLAGIAALSTLLNIYKYYLNPPLSEGIFSYWTSVAASIAIVFVIYEISLKMTENNWGALFSAALAATIPLYTWRTVAQLTHSMAVLLFFLSILVLLYMKEMGDWKPALIIPLILAFVHVYALLFIPILVIYMLLVKLEQKELSRNEIYFSVSSGLLILLIFFFFTAKPALLALVQQYIHINYYSFDTENFSLTGIFAVAGLVPTYVGMFGLYSAMHAKKKSVLLLLSTVVTIMLAVFFNIIPIRLGLPYFSLTLAALAAFFWKACDKTMESTKLKRYKPYLTALGFFIVLAAGTVHMLF